MMTDKQRTPEEQAEFERGCAALDASLQEWKDAEAKWGLAPFGGNVQLKSKSERMGGRKSR